MARSSAGGGRDRSGGRGSGRGSSHGSTTGNNAGEIMARSSTGCGRGRGGGRDSEQVNGHASTDNGGRLTTDAYQPPDEPSDDDDNEPVDVVGWGPVVPPPIPTHENRILIWVENDEFNIHNTVSRTIGSILKLLWSGPWQGWKDVPKLHRDRMFERFQKYYQWEHEDTILIHSCFERCTKGKFPDLLGKARTLAKTRAIRKGIEVGNDWSVIVPFKPQWISEESWKSLVKIWNTSSWKNKSSQNCIKRGKSIGGRHTVGSKSFVTARKELEKGLKQRAMFGEFWLQTHAKKGSRPLDKLPGCSGSGGDDLGEANDVEDIVEEQNVDWVDTRTGDAYESYMELVIEKYGGDSTLHPEFDMELWSRIVGGKKKGRLYGTSNTADPYVVLTGAHSKPGTGSSCPPGRSDKVQRLEEKIAELEREKLAEMERERVEKHAMLEKID